MDMVRNLLTGGKMRLNRINYKPRWDVMKNLWDAYYQCFTKMKNKDGGHMFNKEMDELMEIYEGGMKSINEEIDDIMPMVMAYMEKFLCLNKDKRELKDRMEELQRKIDYQEQDNEE